METVSKRDTTQQARHVTYGTEGEKDFHNSEEVEVELSHPDVEAPDWAEREIETQSDTEKPA